MKSHKTFRSGLLPVLLVPALMAGLGPARAGAATLVVTNTADPGVGGCTASGSGDGCTLREAIIAANNQTLTPGDDTIDATGLSGSITLVTALPLLVTNIILNGPGAASLTVQRSSVAGTPEFRIFTIDNTTTTGPDIVLSGFTIARGKVSGSNAPANCGGGIYNNHGALTVSDCVLQSNSATNGGAICNDGSLSVNATLTLSNSTITNNTATAGGGGLFNNGSGGGSAPLSISNCTFTSNRATNGGAILNDGRTGGSATITELSHSVLSGNTAAGNGGAIENNGTAGGSATLVISDTALSANTATNGGGIDNDGSGGSATQAITDSTFNANTASANGGAINNDGRTAGSATLTAGTSTFNANTAAAKGGAINNDGRTGSATVEIDNSTLKANTASVNSAAIDWYGTGGSATLALGNTILANGPSANLFALIINAETTFTSKNHNLSSDAAGGDGTTAPGGYLSAGGDIRNTDPKFDPAGLKDNGGSTRTIALLPGSPAIDQGLSSSPTDQRGFPRPVDNLFIANAAGGDGSDIGAYELGDAAPALAINDVTVTEGNSGSVNAVFTVSLLNGLNQSVTVHYATSDGTATVGSDYTATSGTLTFNAGQSHQTISAPVRGDALDEANETFKVTLSASNGASIADGLGAGTINDNDPTPRFFINDVTVTENNSGPVAATFHLTLSAASGRTVTVIYKTADGTATAPADYVAHPSTTLTYTPGQTSKTITVLINGDTKDEGNETFKVVLQSATFAAIVDIQGEGTITDNDPLPGLKISAAPAKAEGNSGTHNALFTVTLTGATNRTVTVNYVTANGSASAGNDYTAASGTITFLPGQTSKVLPIQVSGDSTVEPDETFKVNLGGATFATIVDGQGIHTIINDDASE